jgi:hypothetical protein
MKSHYLVIIKTIILVVCCPFFSYADVNISNVVGIVSNTSTIEILGTSFGTKSVAAPILFETFDNRSSGDKIGSEGYWSIRFDGNDDCTYNNTNQRDFTNNAKVVLTYNDKRGAFYKQDIWGAGTVGKKFISAWVYINFDSLVDSDRWQLKLWRASTGVDHTDYIGSAYETWWTAAGDRDGYGHYYEHVGTDYEEPGSVSIRVYEGQWFQMQWEYKDSSAANVEDGQVRFTNLFPDRAERIYVAMEDGYALRTATYPDPVSTPKFGYLIENATSGQGVTTYWDDIYIDNGWSRVELGNASTYDTCTHREMLIPTTWSDTSITATVNTGTFSENDSAYIYVVDSDGNVNGNGYSVVIGESQDSNSSPTSGTDDSVISSDSGTFSLQKSSYIVDRSDGFVYLTISRSDGSDGSASVQWSSNGDTAVHDTDYYGSEDVTVEFSDGEISKEIAIELIQNSATDDREFTVLLSNASDGATLGSVTTATITINGTDTLSPPPELRME